MTRKPYPTDLTDDQGERLQPLLPSPQSGTPSGGRPAADTREVGNALRHRLQTGTARPGLPHDFPPWQTVDTRSRLWRLAGVWDRVRGVLRGEVRMDAGPPPTPDTRRVGSQTVTTTRRGGPKGYDGGKKLAGRTRFVAVDSLGLVCALSVLTADAHDRDGGRWLLAAARGWSPRVREVTAGRGFGRRFIEFVRAVCGRRVTAAAGFEVPPRRWVAERAFARLVSYRRRRVGHESLPETSEAMIQVAMIHPMIRRLEPGRQFQDTL